MHGPEYMLHLMMANKPETAIYTKLHALSVLVPHIVSCSCTIYYTSCVHNSLICVWLYSKFSLLMTGVNLHISHSIYVAQYTYALNGGT